MVQQKSMWENMVFRFKPGTEVYQLSEDTVLFRNDAWVLQCDRKKHLKKSNMKQIVDKLEIGIKYQELGRLLGQEEKDYEVFIVSLINYHVIDTIPTKSGDKSAQNHISLYEQLTEQKIGSPDVMSRTLEDFEAALCVPNDLRQPIRSVLTDHGVSVCDIDMKFLEDGGLSLSLPKKEEKKDRLLVLYLDGISNLEVETLAYELSQRKLAYIPIHRDTGSIVVGPVVTNEVSCIQCYKTRRTSNMDYPEVGRKIATPGVKCLRRSKPIIVPMMANLIAAATQSLIARYLVGLSSDPMSRRSWCCQISTNTLEIKQVVVFKEPFCSACGGAVHTPGRQEFDFRPRPKSNSASS